MSSDANQSDLTGQSIDFLCPLCHVRSQINRAWLGRQALCPACGHPVAILETNWERPWKDPVPEAPAALPPSTIAADSSSAAETTVINVNSDSVCQAISDTTGDVNTSGDLPSTDDRCPTGNFDPTGGLAAVSQHQDPCESAAVQRSPFNGASKPAVTASSSAASSRPGRVVAGGGVGGLLGGVLGVVLGAVLGGSIGGNQLQTRQSGPSNDPAYKSFDTLFLKPADACVGFFGMLLGVGIGAAIGGVAGSVGGSMMGSMLASAGGKTGQPPPAPAQNHAKESAEAEVARLKARIAELEKKPP